MRPPARKSVKWAGWVRGGLIVIGHGWDMFVREKVGVGSGKGGEAEGTKVKGLFSLSTGDNREDPICDVAAKELRDVFVWPKVARGYPPT